MLVVVVLGVVMLGVVMLIVVAPQQSSILADSSWGKGNYDCTKTTKKGVSKTERERKGQSIERKIYI